MTTENFEIKKAMETPIPSNIPSVSGWKEVLLKPSDEQLVPLGVFSDYSHLFTNSLYFGESIDSPYHQKPLKGSLISMFVRKNVANRLSQAQELVGPNYRLMIFDAYRTLDVQGALYNEFEKELKQIHPDWDEQKLSTETQKYVSLPSKDPTRPSPHNTGGAVDLTLVKLNPNTVQDLRAIENDLKNTSPENWSVAYYLEMARYTLMKKYGVVLDMGTPLDHGDKEAGLTYFEEQAGQVRENRRLLYHMMTAVGFEAYSDEWWHYNAPESQMGAKTKGLDHATYEGVPRLDISNILFEKMRLDHYHGISHLFGRTDQFNIKSGTDNQSAELTVVRNALATYGDPRFSQFPKSAIITPN